MAKRNPIIPWRFIVPRSRYRSENQVAKVCPEIRHHIDRAAFYSAAETLVILPLIPLALILWAFKWIVSGIPNFDALRASEIDAAHAVVSRDEIRRRIDQAPAGRAALTKDT